MTYKNLDIVAINHDISEHGLKNGDMGTIVEIFDGGKAFEVEFTSAKSKTLLITLNPAELSPMGSRLSYVWKISPWVGIKQPIDQIIYNSNNAGTKQFSYTNFL